MEPELKKKNKFLEIKKNIKKNLLPTLLIMIGLFGLTYAFFIYRGSGDNRELVAGQLYLNMDESDGFLTLQTLFPETPEQARARDDNTVTFTVTGRNESNQNIYYEINLNEGEELSGYERFNANDLVFDLVEIKSDGTEEYLANAASYDNLNKVRMWVDNVASNNTNFSKTYRLRMWLNENIVISDTESDADYTTEEFMKHYASIKVGVYGDFEEKRMPYNYMTKFPTTITNQKSNITEVNFVNMETYEMESRYNAATIKADLTDTTKSSPGLVYGWLEPDATDTTKYILYVASDGTTFFPKSSSMMFYNWTNLKNINFENINTKYVTNMSYMFGSCSKLTSLDVSDFDTSSVTNMYRMFYYCSGLTSLDLSGFDTRQVTDMGMMFYYCKVLTSLDVSDFDTSRVTDMSSMFYNCLKLTSLDVSGFVTTSVTNMASMFYYCSILTSLDVSGFVTSSVTNMASMFSNCKGLTSLDVSGFDTRQVTDMSSMFSYCSSLTSLDLSNFVTIQVTNMLNMFNNCSNLTSLDVSNFDTSKVTNMNQMFKKCAKLISLDLSNFDTKQVTDMGLMFDECSSLISLDLSNFDTINVTNIVKGNSENGTSKGLFSNCSSLKTLILGSNFTLSKVTDMHAMFYKCSSLTSLDVSGFDTSNVTNMASMFYGCSLLTTIYANTDWNTTTVTSSELMFTNCSKLNGAISYDSKKIDVTYANPSTGYFTPKTA